MVDIEATLRTALLANSPLAAAFGARVWAGVTPPTGYKPADGPGALFEVRGGAPDYSSQVLRPSVQMRVFGLDEATARGAQRVLYDAFQDMKRGRILGAQCEVLGQVLAEPETEWRFVLSYWQMQIANT